VVFADAEDVEADLVGEGDFVDEIVHALGGREDEAAGRIGNGGGEAVDAELHVRAPWFE